MGVYCYLGYLDLSPRAKSYHPGPKYEQFGTTEHPSLLCQLYMPFFIEEYSKASRCQVVAFCRLLKALSSAVKYSTRVYDEFAVLVLLLLLLVIILL